MKKLVLLCSHFLLFNATMVWGQGVDLKITLLDTGQDTLLNDVDFPIDICYKNMGTVINPDKVETVLYLSTDSTLDGSDSELRTFIVPVIGPVNTQCADKTWLYSSETYLHFYLETEGRTGHYYLIATIDPTHKIVESNTSNNTFIKPITVIARDSKVSIEIDSVWTDPPVGSNTINAGESFNITMSIYNRGSMASRLLSNPRVALYKDTSLAPLTDISGGRFESYLRLATNYIGPKSQETENTYSETTTELTAPEVPSGKYYIGISYIEAIDEYTYGDTLIGYLPIIIGRPTDIDLQLAKFVVDKTELQIGEGINVSSTVKNLGYADAGGFFIDYTISDDTILNNGNERYIGNKVPSGLKAGDSIVDNQYLPITDAISPGNYFLIATVNYDELVTETDKSNNTIIIPISIGLVTDILSESSSNSFQIFPNPAAGEVHIRNMNAENIDLKIYDVNNKLIHSEQTARRETNLNLDNGFYIVKISSGSRSSFIEKLIINK